MLDHLIKKFLQFQLNQADASVTAARAVAVPNLDAIREATNNILQANVNGNIGAADRVRIQGYVTQLPRVRSA
jgi:hypothetical protein